VIVFVDFDGTITSVDTLDALVRDAVGDDVWDAIDAELIAGRMTLREGLARQTSFIRKTKLETLAFLEATAVVDPAFAPFVRTAHAHAAVVQVVSSGIRSIIEIVLERAGVSVPIFANDVDFNAAGWTMAFIDESINGHDKAAHVRATRKPGIPAVYIGDGISDFAAAHEANRCFAKAGSSLERYCRAQGIAVESFTSFAQIETALFPAPLTEA
jgi:2-hydroxy-3-keto-5-methylthiopentenyl-1-phosphate phosphatase